MKLYVVRHGETTYNRDELVCGVTNAQLTEKGISQASQLAKDIETQSEKFNIKHIYVSPLDRARNTAAPIEKALNLKAEIEPGIKEFNFGKYEECPISDPKFRELRYKPFVRFDDGESVLTATHRIYSAIDKIIARHKDEDGNILFVCHGTCARIIHTYFHDIEQDDYYKLLIPNCSLIEFDI